MKVLRLILDQTINLGTKCIIVVINELGVSSFPELSVQTLAGHT